MILHLSFDGDVMYPSDWEETNRLISKALHSISVKELRDGEYVAGDQALFCYTEPTERHPSTYLFVAANELSGYGALTWCSDGRPPRQGGIYEYAWISDNPSPPEIDSRLVSETYYPRFYDRASAIPLPQVRAAIEEYCRSGTGERPECIGWTTGEVSGRRYDRPPFEDEVDEGYSEPDWDTFFSGAPRSE
ncbi:Imm1 family immunity protein [Kitasatospora sp. NPDC101235]|uniref:Imm1 family immunity protein n=1 Tax=Kitasatospora sp. NPDC101235 TaxID=3364101 RepID=UPI0038156F04